VYHSSTLNTPAANPEVPIGSSVLSGLAAGTSTKTVSVLDLISKQAQTHGGAVALRQGSERISFAELETLSNQVAHYLLKRGVGEGSRVAVLMERCLRLPVIILGILKAGAAWVPLEPNYPAERLEYIIADSGANLVLTEQHLAARLRIKSLGIQNAEEIFENTPGELPTPSNCRLSGASLAYLIYTSGTTGRPKGVMIEHRNLANYAQALGRATGVTPCDVYLHTASFGFSSSVRQLFLPLSSGAGVVLARYEEIANPLELFALMERASVTIADWVPTYWAACTAAIERVSEPERARLRSATKLRMVLSASEALWSELPRRWRGIFGAKMRLINMFGQTETCGIVTTFTVPEASVMGSHIVPVGKPILNMQVRVLGPDGTSVAPGGVGEIHVGGEDVGRGYVGLPDLTRERFVPDPARPGGRLYKTGDLGRLMPSGDLEFVGREDSQIKIRGQRIELSEIEAVLRSHPGVAEAVVAVREGGPDEQQLFAYFVEKAGTAQDTLSLREHLRKQLPNYMIPAVLLRLERLPLTPNGKIDRKALPMAGAANVKEVSQGSLPADELERQLVKSWEEILKRSPVGTADDFFELGGHSLLAVSLFSRIEDLTGKRLPLATLFEARTIKSLAALLRNKEWQAPWKSLVPIKASGSKPPFFCVHGVGGNIVEFQDLLRYIPSDQPLIGIQAQGLDGKGPRHKTVEEMSAHYLQEIVQFQSQGPYYLGGSSFGGLVALEVARQLQKHGQQIALLAMFDTRAPGYPKWLPNTSAWGKRLSLWQFRLNLHWTNFLAAKGYAKLEYIKVKLNRLWNRRWRYRRLVRERVRATLDNWFHPRAIREVRKAGHEASNDYRCEPYEGKVTLLRAMEQPPGIIEDRTNGWAAYAQGGVEVHDVPGHHGSIMREPRAEVLAATLTACINAAISATGNRG
jgi:amino acid adenylation domain-containing protein